MRYSKIFFFAALCFMWQANASGSTCTLNPTIYTFNFASLNCTIVSDGPVEFPNNPFLVPDAALLRSYKKNFRNAFPIVLSQNVLIIDLPTGRAIFDTGSFLLPEKLPQFPLFEHGGQLMRNLHAAGISPLTIDFIFLTHGHIDHVAGLVSEDGRRVFPNAEVFVGLVEHEFWSNPAPTAPLSLLSAADLAAFAKIYQDAVAPYDRVGKLHVVDSENEDEASPVEGIRFISTFGHAPGHCSIEVKQDDERMVLVGDAWVSTADQLQNPEWGLFSETNGTQAYISREGLLTDLAKTGALVVSYHELFPGLGHVQERGPFFEWVPSAPQLLGFGVKRMC